MGGFWTGFLLYIGWHSWGLHAREAWAYTDEPVIQWLLAISACAGIVVALIWHVIARDYNRHRWPAEHEAWERQVVCRRCGHRFLPDVDLSTSETRR
jgi:hypothetical protein